MNDPLPSLSSSQFREVFERAQTYFAEFLLRFDLAWAQENLQDELQLFRKRTCSHHFLTEKVDLFHLFLSILNPPYTLHKASWAAALSDFFQDKKNELYMNLFASGFQELFKQLLMVNSQCPSCAEGAEELKEALEAEVARCLQIHRERFTILRVEQCQTGIELPISVRPPFCFIDSLPPETTSGKKKHVVKGQDETKTSNCTGGIHDMLQCFLQDLEEPRETCTKKLSGKDKIYLDGYEEMLELVNNPTHCPPDSEYLKHKKELLTTKFENSSPNVSSSFPSGQREPSSLAILESLQMLLKSESSILRFKGKLSKIRPWGSGEQEEAEAEAEEDRGASAVLLMYPLKVKNHIQFFFPSLPPLPSPPCSAQLGWRVLLIEAALNDKMFLTRNQIEAQKKKMDVLGDVLKIFTAKEVQQEKPEEFRIPFERFLNPTEDEDFFELSKRAKTHQLPSHPQWMNAKFRKYEQLKKNTKNMKISSGKFDKVRNFGNLAGPEDFVDCPSLPSLPTSPRDRSWRPVRKTPKAESDINTIFAEHQGHFALIILAFLLEILPRNFSTSIFLGIPKLWTNVVQVFRKIVVTPSEVNNFQVEVSDFMTFQAAVAVLKAIFPGFAGTNVSVFSVINRLFFSLRVADSSRLFLSSLSALQDLIKHQLLILKTSTNLEEGEEEREGEEGEGGGEIQGMERGMDERAFEKSEDLLRLVKNFPPPRIQDEFQIMNPFETPFFLKKKRRKIISFFQLLHKSTEAGIELMTYSDCEGYLPGPKVFRRQVFLEHCQKMVLWSVSILASFGNSVVPRKQIVFDHFGGGAGSLVERSNPVPSSGVHDPPVVLKQLPKFKVINKRDTSAPLRKTHAEKQPLEQTNLMRNIKNLEDILQTRRLNALVFTAKEHGFETRMTEITHTILESNGAALNRPSPERCDMEPKKKHTLLHSKLGGDDIQL